MRTGEQAEAEEVEETVEVEETEKQEDQWPGPLWEILPLVI